MVMAMAAVSIAASVVVLDLHHHDSTRQVPTFLALFVFGKLSRVLGIFNPYGYVSEVVTPTGHTHWTRPVAMYS